MRKTKSCQYPLLGGAGWQPALLGLLGLLLAGASSAAEPLIANGSFTDLDAKGMPVGWAAGGKPVVLKENGNTWVRIEKDSVLSQTVKLVPDAAKLKLSVRMRVTSVVLGNEGWKDARLALEFRDAANKHLDPWPNSPHAVETTDWVVYDRVLPVPAGAATFTMGCSMLGDSGTVYQILGHLSNAVPALALLSCYTDSAGRRCPAFFSIFASIMSVIIIGLVAFEGTRSGFLSYVAAPVAIWYSRTGDRHKVGATVALGAVVFVVIMFMQLQYHTRQSGGLTAVAKTQRKTRTKADFWIRG